MGLFSSSSGRDFEQEYKEARSEVEWGYEKGFYSYAERKDAEAATIEREWRESES